MNKTELRIGIVELVLNLTKVAITFFIICGIIVIAGYFQ